MYIAASRTLHTRELSTTTTEAFSGSGSVCTFISFEDRLNEEKSNKNGCSLRQRKAARFESPPRLLEPRWSVCVRLLMTYGKDIANS